MTTRITAALALGLGLALLGPTGAALAHNAVIGTTPDAGETLTAVPAEFSVTTNEAMLDVGGSAAGFGIVVTDADGLHYGDGCLTIDGDTVSMPATLGPAGDYTMTYQYVSADGHILSDQLSFSYEPTGDAEATLGSPEPLECGEAAPQPEPEPNEPAEPAPAESAPTDSAPVEETPEPAPSSETDTVLWIVAALGGAVVLVALISTLAVLAARRRQERSGA